MGINYQMYDWADVKGREQPQLRYKIDKFEELIGVIPFRDYAGTANLRVFRYFPQDAKKMFGYVTYVNNASYFLVYTWKDFKISIAGDLESDGMKPIVDSDNVQKQRALTF